MFDLCYVPQFKAQNCSVFILTEGLLLQGLVCLINLFNSVEVRPLT